MCVKERENVYKCLTSDIDERERHRPISDFSKFVREVRDVEMRREEERGWDVRAEKMEEREIEREEYCKSGRG